MFDSSEILKTNTVEPRSPNTFHLKDTIKSHNLDTIKHEKSVSTIPKINLPHKNSIGDDLGSDFIIFFKDWGGYLTYPFRMKGTDWLIGGAAIGGTVLSSLADRSVHTVLGDQNAANSKYNFFNLAAYYGYIYYQAAFAGGLYLAGLFTRSDGVRETGRLLMQSFTYSGTITISLRILFGRERPYITDNPYKFHWLTIKSLDTQSFPSGHTAVAFAASTILAERIGTWWSRVIFYGAAGLVGFSKIRTNQHWLSDVVFGGILGFSSSWFVLKREEDRINKKKKREEKKGGGFSFYPSFNGFSIVYNFK
jgi:membrane-associated phospholipid phosphatase